MMGRRDEPDNRCQYRIESMEKILIIDDNVEIRETVKKDLETDTCQVLAADNGHEGLNILRQEKPAVVITDFKMPGMNGNPVTEAIRAIDEDVEIIVITGYGDLQYLMRFLRPRML